MNFYIEHVYDKQGNITEVTAYNDVMLEYQLTEVFKTYYDEKYDEYRVKPQYALENW